MNRQRIYFVVEYAEVSAFQPGYSCSFPACLLFWARWISIGCRSVDRGLERYLVVGFAGGSGITFPNLDEMCSGLWQWKPQIGFGTWVMGQIRAATPVKHIQQTQQ